MKFYAIGLVLLAVLVVIALFASPFAAAHGVSTIQQANSNTLCWGGNTPCNRATIHRGEPDQFVAQYKTPGTCRTVCQNECNVWGVCKQVCTTTCY